MTEPARRSNSKLLVGSALALVAAGAVVVLFVLPAEYGIDPTGLGQRMGLVEMAEPENIYLERGRKRTGVLYPLQASAAADGATLQQTLAGKATVPGELKRDRFQFELMPFEGIELKYELAQGAPMIFKWSATAPVNFDMHAHPYQGGDKLTESYVITDAASQTAAYVAPFTGIHGWYWQNQTLEPVTLTLDTTGAMTKSMTFDQAGEHPRALEAPADPAEKPGG